MSTKPYDLVLRGGTVGTASAVFPADVAIAGETIAAIGRNFRPARRRSTRAAKLVLPGGVDSHAHIEQLFGRRHRQRRHLRKRDDLGRVRRHHDGHFVRRPAVGMKLAEVVDDYHALAKKGAVIDYAFHMIIADPTEATLQNDIPKLVKRVSELDQDLHDL